MEQLPSLENLIDYLRRLPSVGRKSAERMAFALLKMDQETLEKFAKAILELQKNIHPCPICGNYTEKEICSICRDSSRDHQTCVVVSTPQAVKSFTELGTEFNGVFHVLGGDLSATSGIGIEDLNVKNLLKRIENDGLREIIIATNPTMEGETTALYLAQILKQYPVKVSRLAYGLPIGGHIDYADALTLKKALEGRTDI
ncbi:MAG: recombination mediator RecR [Bacilli bacterium]|jgi:recombination protein RecR